MTTSRQIPARRSGTEPRRTAKTSPQRAPARPTPADLQQRLGNSGVASKLHPRQKVKSPTTPRNDPARLAQAVSLEQLFALYSTNADEYIIGPLPPSSHNPTFTRAWIRGAGQKTIQAEITLRVSGLGERQRIQYLNYLDESLHPKDYDSARKLWLRDQIGAGLALTYEQRIELRRVVGDRMNDAYTDFTAAAQANVAAIKATVNADAAVFSLILDVFMGLAAPGIGRGIAALANRIPVAASNLTYRVALAGLDTSRTGLILAAATKIGKETIKLQASALFGQTDVDLFIRGLKESFRKGTDAVNVDLPNKTDEELGVLASIYDPDASSEAVYTPQIKALTDRFKKQIMSIGPLRTILVSAGADIVILSHTMIVWVIHGSEAVLTVVHFQTNAMGLHPIYLFQAFIDRDLRDIAMVKARETQHGIEDIPERQIIAFPRTIPATATKR